MESQSPAKPWASPEVIDQILTAGRAAVPAEACGVITPDLRVVVLPNHCPNGSRDSFVIQGEDLVSAIADYVESSGVNPDELRREHFMVWHTHPSGSVGPSLGDMSNRLEGFQNLVVALPNGEATTY